MVLLATDVSKCKRTKFSYGPARARDVKSRHLGVGDLHVLRHGAPSGL